MDICTVVWKDGFGNGSDFGVGYNTEVARDALVRRVLFNNRNDVSWEYVKEDWDKVPISLQSHWERRLSQSKGAILLTGI